MFGVLTVHTTLGTVRAEAGGLEMVKFPIAKGEAPTCAFKNYFDSLKHLLYTLPCTEPAYALVLAVVGAFALANGDFLLDAIALLADSMLDFHHLSDVIHIRALSLPWSFSRALLHRSVCTLRSRPSLWAQNTPSPIWAIWG